LAVEAALLDVDGTLIDSNYHHALAWYRAFRRHDIVLPLWRIHRGVGMGGDQLVPALVGPEVDNEKGDGVRAAREEIYKSDPLRDHGWLVETGAARVRGDRGLRIGRRAAPPA
jgi:beta-phosphoglucomutase-like phosphatase (HAD superfamily)